MSIRCAVIGCSNGNYKLSRWQPKELHHFQNRKVLHHNVGCTFEPPFNRKEVYKVLALKLEEWLCLHFSGKQITLR